MVSFKGAHFAKDIILTCVRWYVAYPLSYRQGEELVEEHGVSVDHAMINRGVLNYAPQLEAACHRRKRPVWCRWRREETYIKLRGHWCYLYRAVNKSGHTIDCLLTEHRDEQSARRFLRAAIRRHGVPEKITIDGSEANVGAIRHYNDTHGTAVTLRQVKSLHNISEQDPRTVKGGTRPLLGFKAEEAAHATLAGVKCMHMLRKGPLAVEAAKGLPPAQQFSVLAASFHNLTTLLGHRAKIATKPKPLNKLAIP